MGTESQWGLEAFKTQSLQGWSLCSLAGGNMWGIFSPLCSNLHQIISLQFPQCLVAGPQARVRYPGVSKRGWEKGGDRVRPSPRDAARAGGGSALLGSRSPWGGGGLVHPGDRTCSVAPPACSAKGC